MIKKNKIWELMDKLKSLLKGKNLPSDAVFQEKPCVFLVLCVYVMGIVALFLINTVNIKIIPVLTIQLVNSFKGVKQEWLNSIFRGMVNLVYLLILIFVFYYNIKRETTTYTLTKKEILIKKGLFIRKEVYLPLTKIRNVSLETSLFGLIFKYGTILIDTGGFTGVMPLSNIPRPKEKVVQILEKLDKKTVSGED